MTIGQKNQCKTQSAKAKSENVALSLRYIKIKNDPLSDRQNTENSCYHYVTLVLRFQGSLQID